MVDMKDENKVGAAIEELRSLAFRYARLDDEIKQLKEKLNQASFDQSGLGSKLAEAHYKHKDLLGRLSNNLTVVAGPFTYHFEIDCDGVVRFTKDTAI